MVKAGRGRERNGNQAIITGLGCYTDTMSTLRATLFWTGLGIAIGTIVVLIIWPEFFGPFAIAALFGSFAMMVLARPWERRKKSNKDV